MRKSDKPDDDLVSNGFPPDKQQSAKKTCGSEVRHRYTNRQKAGVVSELRELESRRPEVVANYGMTPLNCLEHKTRISISNISK